jgi:multidrug resistance efflux pump
MFDMILSAIGGWKIKLLAAGLAVAVIGGYVLYLRADAADARADAAQLRANVAVLEETNRRTVESFRRYQAEQERARAALVREAERAATRASELSTLTSEAENAPDDRPVGPVLQRGFERLRLLDGTAGGG